MANVDEVLGLNDTEAVLTVDSNLRTIVIPNSVTNLGVESDDNVLSLPFRIPRYYDGIDLSTFDININYLNAKGSGDRFEVHEPTINTDTIEFEWLIGRYAAMYAGKVHFNLCLKELSNGVVTREFNTTPAALPILEGLEVGEKIIQEYADVIEQWRYDLFESGNSVVKNIEESGARVLSNIDSAVDTYVAEHQEELRGPKGDAGAGLKIVGQYASYADLEEAIMNGEISQEPGDAYTVVENAGLNYDFYNIYIIDANGVPQYNGTLQGPPGYSPVRDVDYWTEEDRAEIVTNVLAELTAAEDIEV